MSVLSILGVSLLAGVIVALLLRPAFRVARAVWRYGRGLFVTVWSPKLIIGHRDHVFDAFRRP